MPKRTSAERNRAQRQKIKNQKAFELVLPEGAEIEDDEPGSAEPLLTKIATPIAEKIEVAEVEQSTDEVTLQQAPKGSAAARIAARRIAAKKSAQRNANVLITPEHYLYVKRDLRRIAILACFVFAAIIVLYFMYGRGA